MHTFPVCLYMNKQVVILHIIIIYVKRQGVIRASVDALCRDGGGQISRERVQRGRLVQQEQQAEPQKHTARTHRPICSSSNAF